MLLYKRIKNGQPDIYIVAEPRSAAAIMEAESKARKERAAVTLEEKDKLGELPDL